MLNNKTFKHTISISCYNQVQKDIKDANIHYFKDTEDYSLETGAYLYFLSLFDLNGLDTFWLSGMLKLCLQRALLCFLQFTCTYIYMYLLFKKFNKESLH